MLKRIRADLGDGLDLRPGVEIEARAEKPPGPELTLCAERALYQPLVLCNAADNSARAGTCVSQQSDRIPSNLHIKSALRDWCDCPTIGTGSYVDL